MEKIISHKISKARVITFKAEVTLSPREDGTCGVGLVMPDGKLRYGWLDEED